MRDPLDEAAELLRRCDRVLFITGAGISADSGLPTYRGIGGLYDDSDTEEGVTIEEALSGQMLRRRPALTWKYIHQIEGACRGAEPNEAHRILVQLEQELAHACVLTQNVDGLHCRAGSRNVIDIHGDIHRLSCVACAYRKGVTDYSGLEPVPRCPCCGSTVRPDVVLFGELLPANEIARLHRELDAGFDAVFSVGTSSTFEYIAGPVLNAQRAGIPTVEINPGRTEVSSRVDIKVPSGAADAFGALWRRLQS